MKIFSIFVFLLVCSAFQARLEAKETPLPKLYKNQGACPGECCVFRDWSVERDAVFYDKPKGTKIVGKVKKGEWVEGLTGITYTPQTKLKVIYPHAPNAPEINKFSPKFSYKAGDILYMFDQLGEGFSNVWFKGKFVVGGEQVYCSKLDNSLSRCKPSEDCWVKVVGPCNQDKMEWWVKVKPKNGPAGWVKEERGERYFGNKDSCG